MTQPNLTTAVIIAARMDSTRLPGKPLVEVCGRPLIDYVFERVHRTAGVDHFALATTDRPVDEGLAEYAETRGLLVFRGDTDDVALRLLACAEWLGADQIVRVNGDSPFIDPALLGKGVAAADESYDLVSNIPGRTFPYGASVEVLKTEALKRAHPRMSAAQREHVTSIFYENEHDYAIRTITSDEPRFRAARLVVDTDSDLRAFEDVVRRLGDKAALVGYREAAALYIEMGHTL